MTTRLITWDWKEHVDFDILKQIISDLSQGKIRMFEVDTGSDQFAWVISDEPLTDEQAREAYISRWAGWD